MTAARRSVVAATVRRLCRDDRGTVSAGMLGTVVLLILLGGLLLDPGMAIAARVRALDVAQAAARAGANQIDLAALRTSGVIQLRPDAAASAARAFLAGTGLPGTVTATTATVTVTVTTSQPTQLLRLVGLDSLPVTATASARAATSAGP